MLGRAHSPDDPDWRMLSAQGATLDQLGRYEEARQYYASALKIAPDEPSVLSNLGLSYVLSKDLPKAEETLRRAYSLAPTDPRVRANLALVVGLQGRVAEAEKIAKADLPPEEAAANVAQLKRILSRKEKENARAEVGKMPIAARRTLRLERHYGPCIGIRQSRSSLSAALRPCGAACAPCSFLMIGDRNEPRGFLVTAWPVSRCAICRNILVVR